MTENLDDRWKELAEEYGFSPAEAQAIVDTQDAVRNAPSDMDDFFAGPDEPNHTKCPEGHDLSVVPGPTENLLRWKCPVCGWAENRPVYWA